MSWTGLYAEVVYLDPKTYLEQEKAKQRHPMIAGSVMRTNARDYGWRVVFLDADRNLFQMTQRFYPQEPEWIQ